MRITRGGLLTCQELSALRGAGKGKQKSAEGIVGLFDRTECPNMKEGVGDLNFVDPRDTEGRTGRCDISSDGSGRNPREDDAGASKVTVRRAHFYLETEQLMEAVVEGGNMEAAYRRVMGNRGTAGVDGMPVEALKPYLCVIIGRASERSCRQAGMSHSQCFG